METEQGGRERNGESGGKGRRENGEKSRKEMRKGEESEASIREGKKK